MANCFGHYFHLIWSRIFLWAISFAQLHFHFCSYFIHSSEICFVLPEAILTILNQIPIPIQNFVLSIPHQILFLFLSSILLLFTNRDILVWPRFHLHIYLCISFLLAKYYNNTFVYIKCLNAYYFLWKNIMIIYLISLF